MQEVWKDVPDYEGLYQVSNLGRVKSLSRYVNGRKPNVRPVRERILKFSMDKDKYHEVVLCPNGKVRKHHRVHRLVAQAFIPNPDNLPEIDHIDGDPENNRADNLRWVTRQQNEMNPITRQRLSLAKAGDKCPNFGKRGTEVHNARKVKRISANGDIKCYNSIADAARENNIRATGISGCLCGKNKTSGGYKWEYQ